MKISWELPLKIVSEANISEHWTAKSKRHKFQQKITRIAFNQNRPSITLPCTIRLIRMAPRALDAEENLPMAFKWIKDEIGAYIFPEKVHTYFKKNGTLSRNKGHADSDSRVKWEFAQEKSKTYSFRVEISFEDS